MTNPIITVSSTQLSVGISSNAVSVNLSGTNQVSVSLSNTGPPGTIPSLSSGNIFVGNSSNVATAVAMSGDATIISSGALTIASSAVTYAKMQLAGSSILLGNPTSSSAHLQQITLGTNLSFSGSVLNASSGGGTPGGTPGQIQYNNSGAFGGANITYGTDGSGNPRLNSTNTSTLNMGGALIWDSGNIYSNNAGTLTLNNLIANDNVQTLSINNNINFGTDGSGNPQLTSGSGLLNLSAEIATSNIYGANDLNLWVYYEDFSGNLNLGDYDSNYGGAYLTIAQNPNYAYFNAPFYLNQFGDDGTGAQFQVTIPNGNVWLSGTNNNTSDTWNFSDNGGGFIGWTTNAAGWFFTSAGNQPATFTSTGSANAVFSVTSTAGTFYAGVLASGNANIGSAQGSSGVLEIQDGNGQYQEVLALNFVVSGASGTSTASQLGVLTNTRIKKRVQTSASGTSISVNSDSFDVVEQTNTAVSGTLTINNPTGTPVTRQSLAYCIKSTNSQTFSWGINFEGSSANPLPTNHPGGSLEYDYTFWWSGLNSKWLYTGMAGGYS